MKALFGGHPVSNGLFGSKRITVDCVSAHLPLARDSQESGEVAPLNWKPPPEKPRQAAGTTTPGHKDLLAVYLA